jgi:hypothetical protein
MTGLTIKQQLSRNLINAFGHRSNRKIVVIESDDWGSIRIPSKDTYHLFVKKGYGVESSAYNRYDSLESDNDLQAIFEVLSSFKDIHNNPAVFTANCIIANPDFEKIRKSGFNEYHYEPVAATLQHYPAHQQVVHLWKEGLQKKLFIPQCHGREHLHVGRWMKRLQSGDKDVLFCFDQHTTFSGDGKTDYSFMEALDFDHISELDDLNKILAEGLQLFHNFFGYTSKSFIAPCYTWHPGMEPVMKANAVKYIQGNITQLQPPLINNQYKVKYHYMGQRSGSGLRYLIRNCIFEPTLHPQLDSVSRCLNQIDIAFQWNKPAIISSHRLNYIGCLDESNRIKNLALLKKLLSAIQKKWPDVEFMSTDQLGEMMFSKQ